jgi:hypothetical protein
MTILLIILLILLVIYLYYQNRKLQTSSDNSAGSASSGDHSEKIFELDEDLIADKDAAIRAKNEAEAENLALSNHLRLKNQEVTRKDNEIQRLKKEKTQSEIALNQKIKE